MDDQQQQGGWGAFSSWVSSSFRLQPSPEPLPSDSSRAFASDPLPATPAGPLPQLPGGTLTDTQCPVKVYMLNKDQEWDIQGAEHVVQLCGVTERHVPVVTA